MVTVTPSRSVILRRSLAAVALGILVAGSVTAAQQTPAYRENVVVREVEVSVQLPDDLSIFTVRTLKPQDFLVRRDGEPEEVTRVEPAWHGKSSEPWTIVVYVDRVLSTPATANAALAALTHRVGRLTELGRVDLVVADPEPHAVRSGERDAKALAAGLGQVAAGLGAERSPARAVDPENVRRQLDRLLAWLAAQRTVGPRLLWLVADGMPLSLDALAVLGEKPAQGLERGLPVTADRVAAEAVREAARCLAAYGWVTLAGPLGRPEEGAIGPRLSDYERFRRDVWNQPAVAVPILRWPWTRTAPTRLSTSQLVAALDPQLAPLRHLALTTSGWLVPAESDVDPVMDALFQRFRVWFRAADPLDGRLHELRLKLVKGAQDLRAPRWVRSSTPEAITEARLRDALERGEPGGSLPLRAALQPGAAGSGELDLQIEVAAGSGEGGVVSPVRLSWAVATDHGIVFGHRTLAQPVDLRAAGLSQREALPVAGAVRRAAVLVESMADESWGIGLAAPPAANP